MDTISSGQSITMNDLVKLQVMMDSMIPEYNHKDIDDFVARGNKIGDIAMMTSVPQFRDITKLRTKHGMLKVQYSPMIPLGSIILVRVPQSFPFIPEFSREEDKEHDKRPTHPTAD